jgi:NAD+ kinase
MTAIAANDVALGRRYGHGPARVSLRLAGVPVTSLVGDGILFASPGGSTAHNLNAGGPVLSPMLRALVLRTLNARAPMPGALVLHADEPVTVVVALDSPVLVAEVDGRVVGEVAPGAELTVSVPDTPARLLRTSAPQFFGELAERLAQRRRRP